MDHSTHVSINTTRRSSGTQHCVCAYVCVRVRVRSCACVCVYLFHFWLFTNLDRSGHCKHSCHNKHSSKAIGNLHMYVWSISAYTAKVWNGWVEGWYYYVSGTCPLAHHVIHALRCPHITHTHTPSRATRIVALPSTPHSKTSHTTSHTHTHTPHLGSRAWLVSPDTLLLQRPQRMLWHLRSVGF